MLKQHFLLYIKHIDLTRLGTDSGAADSQRARAWGTSGGFERHDTSERELWDRAGENGFGPRLQITIDFIWKFNRWIHFPFSLHDRHAKADVKNHRQGMESKLVISNQCAIKWLVS